MVEDLREPSAVGVVRGLVGEQDLGNVGCRFGQIAHRALARVSAVGGVRQQVVADLERHAEQFSVAAQGLGLRGSRPAEDRTRLAGCTHQRCGLTANHVEYRRHVAGQVLADLRLAHHGLAHVSQPGDG